MGPRIAMVCLAAALAGPGSATAQPRGGPKVRKVERVAALNEAIATLNARPSQRNAEQLLSVVRNERDQRLRSFGLGILLDRKRNLSAGQRREVEKVRSELHHASPEIPATGLIRVAHTSGPEFYSAELASYRRAGFEVTELSSARATASRGRIRVTLRRGDENIFRGMGDPRTHVVIYSGHSNVGGVVDQSLSSSPRQRGSKLLLLLQCVGTQTLPMVRARYGRAQLVTTKRPSYDYEDFSFVQSMYNGLERGESWAAIRRRGAARESTANYLLPNESSTLRHGDLDGDGRLDLGPRGDRRFDLVTRGERRASQNLLMAVGYLNQMHLYHTEENKPSAFTLAEVKDRFRSGGLAQSTGRDRVTEIVVRRTGGHKVSEVRLNPRFARAPHWFIEAASSFEMHLHLMRSLRGKATRRDRLRATIYAGDYLLRFAPDRDQCDAAIRRLARMHRLGPLTWDDLEPVLLVEPDKTATETQLDLLDRALGAAASRKASARTTHARR